MVGRTMLKRHNSVIPLALKCALFFLAFSVFNFGLQAKLSLYHPDPSGAPPISSMAKLSTERHSACPLASLERQDLSRVTPESLRFAAVVFLLHCDEISSVAARVS